MQERTGNDEFALAHAERMRPAKERLLRLMVIAGDVVGEYPFEDMATEEPRKMRLFAAHDKRGWRLDSAWPEETGGAAAIFRRIVATPPPFQVEAFTPDAGCRLRL